MKKALNYILPLLLVLFGLLTLFLSSSVIFDWFGIREKEGNYVLFIVWSNFVSSLIYIITAFGVLKRQKWAIYLLAISTAILTIAFACFLYYINSGGIHETKTIGAMVFRTSITIAFTFTAYYLLKTKRNEN
ncbi:MAG: hypothetical protein DWP98_09140 [Bacteroidetes bacterium]|nr:MAG: hypothetical protein DWP98_09140 [Bacteroidota bacterium]MBL1145712.1 hypothetical protein [Bacteroidota bacterium]MCB0802985.1 hypothetical protein [Flavobacteriales bacterium]NOG58506.1 hypothetical protein [Bacteroidota bacterium]